MHKSIQKLLIVGENVTCEHLCPTIFLHEVIGDNIVDEGVRVAVVLNSVVYCSCSGCKAYQSLMTTLERVLKTDIHKVNILDHIEVEAL